MQQEDDLPKYWYCDDCQGLISPEINPDNKSHPRCPECKTPIHGWYKGWGETNKHLKNDSPASVFGWAFVFFIMFLLLCIGLFFLWILQMGKRLDN